MSRRTSLLTCVGLVVPLACRVGPDHRPPDNPLPEAFSHAGSGVASASNASASELDSWWTVFGDPALEGLIGRAWTSNLDVRVAHSRVREARALRGTARSASLPQVDASAGYARVRPSENSLVGKQLERAGQDLSSDAYALGTDASWELDLFGGTGRAVEAAEAELEASVEAGRDVLVGVLAEVGLAYVDLRGAQARLVVARDNLDLQEATLSMTRDRSQAGLATELDVARAEAQAADTRASLAPLDEERERAVHRLGILLGEPPGELEAELSVDAPIPSAAPRVPVGLPSDLLRRRPDIRRAERRVAAATARIGAATADLFPRFYLTGALALESTDSGDLLAAGSRAWSLGPSLRWPLLSGGRVRQNIRVQGERQEQALLDYEHVVLRAMEEVENALVAFGREQERHRALVDAEAASRRAAALADDLHRGGLVGFLDVLSAQGTRLAAQDELVQSERRLSQNLVRLYAALGGGWQAGHATSAPELAGD